VHLLVVALGHVHRAQSLGADEASAPAVI
jgi:hypothetical protein